MARTDSSNIRKTNSRAEDNGEKKNGSGLSKSLSTGNPKFTRANPNKGL